MGFLNRAHQLAKVVQLVPGDQAGIVCASVSVMAGKEGGNLVSQNRLDRLDVRIVPPDEVSQQVFDRPTAEKDFISLLGRQRIWAVG